MKNRWKLRASVLMLVSLMAMTTLSVAAEVGTAEDPLVTLSYLQQTFLDTLMGKVDVAIAQRDAELNAEIDEKIATVQGSLEESGTTTTPSNDTFAVVTLSQGQVLYGDIGCEVMLRVGTATCVASGSPGLIDQTSGSIIESGTALTKNHLCMMTIENRGVQATAATVKLMVRGGYTIG